MLYLNKSTGNVVKEPQLVKHLVASVSRVRLSRRVDGMVVIEVPANVEFKEVTLVLVLNKSTGKLVILVARNAPAKVVAFMLYLNKSIGMLVKPAFVQL